LRDIQVYVEDIIEAINNIEKYTRGLNYDSFAIQKFLGKTWRE